jgi:beta-glucosidase
MDNPANTSSKGKHHHSPLIFPDGFLWGSATSAHQVEGNNIHSDWWAWENKYQPPEKRSGLACDFYNRYEEDFDLLKKFSHNTHRLSVEWARIEPEEGVFDKREIEHYKKVLAALKERGFTVMLTMWHFTLPKWLSDKGGFENSKIVDYFERYLKVVVPELREYVDFWITLNEPQIYAFLSYFMGYWPPAKKSKVALIKVTLNMINVHKRAYKTIHSLVPDAQVGLAQNNSTFSALHKHSIREDLTIWLLDYVNNHFFIKMTGVNTHDFFGINYYFHRYISLDQISKGYFPKLVDISTTKKEVTDMGWEIYPQGMFDTIMDFADYHKPIYITENGLASTNDDRRCRFLIAYLQEIYHAIQAGAGVKGYFHWSSVDNFEWADGFKPRFGLIEIDYKNLKRTPRPSAYVYSDIIRHNGIPHTLLRFLGHTVDAAEVLEMEHNCPPELCPVPHSTKEFMQSPSSAGFVV